MPVAGPLPHAALQMFLERSGFVLAAEATSQLRFGSGVQPEMVFDAFEPLLGGHDGDCLLEPDFVLQLGDAPTGSGLCRWLASDRAPDRVVVARRGYPEAFNRAVDVWITDPALVIAGLAERMDGIAPEADWAARTRRESDRIWHRLEELLSAEEGLPEPAAVRAAIEAVPTGGLLALGNSLPVREADLFCPASERSLAVVSQRGASGIDGGISGATGAVSASGFPGLLLLGDVSFQHDLGGLAAARELDGSLAIVVLCNGGGRLFDLLPIRAALRDDPPAYERFFRTAPAVDPVGAAASFGVAAEAVGSATELGAAIGEALDRPGATVIAAHIDGLPAADWIRRLSGIVD
jgi:2-succinyl-5-enolpyruvyl-6-hydroxy-3-cyclohexene-1-carboxylate synthase